LLRAQSVSKSEAEWFSAYGFVKKTQRGIVWDPRSGEITTIMVKYWESC
jgi:hypothetical protein